jgi:predicted metal-binding membrane protein
MTMHTSWLERTIRRDELIVGAGLLVVAALSWVYLLRMAAAMDAAASEAAMHAAMGMTMAGDSMAASELLSLWVMWTVMMAAMMLPSAAPVALVVLGAYRRRGGAGAVLSSYAFVLGYLLAWTAFSLVAAAGQLWLRQAALLSPEMASTSRVLAGVVLAGAGVYQWLPIKGACLSHCRSPLDFLMRHWRQGRTGALAMGARHGLFCVGCCWALMALLFVAGVMNLLWVAIIAAFVLVEKQFSAGARMSRVAGALLLAWGAWVMLQA